MSTDKIDAQELELARQARREYDRQYRAANREKCRQWQRAYWARRMMREAQDGKES